MKTTLAFMAAGFGSRFVGGVKQLEPVGPNGEVLMDYAVHDALAAGFDRVVFIIRRDLEDQFRRGVGGRTEKKCEVEYVFQDVTDLPPGFAHLSDRKKPWGTGHAVLACRNVIDGPFCVLNADDYYGPEVFRRIYSFLQALDPADPELKLCMAGYVLGNTLTENGAVTRGICHADESGRLMAIRETKGVEMKDGIPCSQEGGQTHMISGDALVSMNIWGLPAGFMDYLQERFVPFLAGLGSLVQEDEFLLPGIVGEMIQLGRGTVQVLPTHDRWFGMTYAQDRLLARERIQKLIKDGIYPDRI